MCYIVTNQYFTHSYDRLKCCNFSMSPNWSICKLSIVLFLTIWPSQSNAFNERYRFVLSFRCVIILLTFIVLQSSELYVSKANHSNTTRCNDTSKTSMLFGFLSYKNFTKFRSPKTTSPQHCGYSELECTKFCKTKNYIHHIEIVFNTVQSGRSLYRAQSLLSVPVRSRSRPAFDILHCTEHCWNNLCIIVSH